MNWIVLLSNTLFIIYSHEITLDKILKNIMLTLSIAEYNKEFIMVEKVQTPDFMTYLHTC